MKRVNTRLLAVLAALGLLAGVAPASAQTALTQTALSAAIAGSADQTMIVASATGITATSSQAQYYAVIDREVIGIRSVNGTVIGITRGQFNTRGTGHASGTTVYILPAGSPFLSKYDRAGACTTAGSSDPTQDGSYSPVINVDTGSLFICSGAPGIWQRGDITTTFAGGNAAAHVFKTGSAYTNATTTFSSVTGLSFPVRANQNYAITCTILWQGSAATTGPKYQFTGPSSPTSVAANAFSAVTATTVTQASATAFSSAMANAGTITTATNFADTVRLGLINGANAGTVQLQAAANGAGTLTIQPGSYCLVQ